ncbi:MAG: Fur family transcriptional regulator [Planctomycetota bacterium]|jgi:Fur family ferric uptake transcriptional regulator
MKKEEKSKPEKMLTRAKLRCTSGRVAILKVLVRARKPLTREEIASELDKKGLNKVTIYRALERFVHAGLVHRAFLHNRTWHFELSDNCTESQCHPHFTCTDCGSTHCLTEILLPMTKSPHKGFVIGRQRVQLEGLCPECNANKRPTG